MGLSGVLLLLAPPLGAIIFLRPSWPEFLLLTLPLMAVMLAAFFAFRFATFIAVGLIGVVVLLCSLNIDAEGQDIVTGPVTPGLLDRLLRARENAPSSERARRRTARLAEGRHLALARFIGAECILLSLVSGFVFG